MPNMEDPLAVLIEGLLYFILWMILIHLHLICLPLKCSPEHHVIADQN